MRIPRFYINQPLDIGLDITLPDEIHRHAIQVLRLKEGERLILFNGVEGEYQAKLTSAERRRSKVQLVSFDAVNRESPLKVTLALAMIKQDKMDFAIQKAVEMGVQNIQPLYTHRSVIKLKANRLEKKLAHWDGIIKAACEQSGRTSIPQLFAPSSLDIWLKKPSLALQIAMLPGEYPSISELDSPKHQHIHLIVGPEGGFTDYEVHLLLTSNVKGIQFGPRILRAETAVIAGTALCEQLWGDLSSAVNK
jgi:16S rRNA (uracil1498-N3)-methyltransferase